MAGPCWRLLWGGAVVLLSALLCTACTDKDAQLEAYIKDDFPTRIVAGFVNQYRDSGRVKVVLKAPVLVEYDNQKRKYKELPKGLQVQWLKADSVQGFLRADYAIVQQADTTYEVRGHVLVVTPDRDSILTSRIVWDRVRKRFYSPAKTTVLSKGSVLPGEGGFEASEDLSYYRLLKPRDGKIQVETNR